MAFESGPHASTCTMTAEDDEDRKTVIIARADAERRAIAQRNVEHAKRMKRALPGLTLKQQATLDAMHPDGWTVAAWTSPSVLLDPADAHLSEHENPNLFGGCHYVVNGAHILMKRNGTWLGYYAWGGQTYPGPGGRKPWNAIVKTAALSGHRGNRVPGPQNIVRMGR